VQPRFHCLCQRQDFSGLLDTHAFYDSRDEDEAQRLGSSSIALSSGAVYSEGNAFIPLSGRTRRQGECSIALTAKRISTKFSMVLTLSVHATSGVHHVTSFGRVDTAIGGFGK
jgi:hypothetical protein